METVAASSVSQVGSTNTYEFSAFVSTLPATGPLTVALASGWLDSSDNVGTAAANRTITVAAAPSATIILPGGDIYGPQEIGSLAVRVEFTPSGSNSILRADITADLLTVCTTS